MSRKPVPTTELLAALVDGEVTASEAAALEREVAASRDSQVRLAQLQKIRDTLATPAPELAQIDLVPSVGRAMLEPSPSEPRRLRAYVCGLLAAAAACAGLALITVDAPRAVLNREFRAKSAGAPGERHAVVHVYRPRGQLPPALVNSEISKSDGLLFSYSNVGERPFEYLMIFGVDATQVVRWFYPAFVEQGTDPASMPISVQESQALLPDIIEHDLAPGAMDIYALFTEQPLRVSEIESWLRTQGMQPSAPPLSAAQLQRIPVAVGP